ncbi:hypothetical protein NIES23_36670 [Trichormus variabilis NIES-23]|uniref:Uncharacterized protein n=1 Tax=Trichormus variabilis NIES-23 TaxID=1973479 RepID=A0A1Z4KPL4_ANAVA|nr:hypothetical protein NIES23_36670 [Trichormus variabilis NIES-23]
MAKILSIFSDFIYYKVINTITSFTRHTWLRRLLSTKTHFPLLWCSQPVRSLIEAIIENNDYVYSWFYLPNNGYYLSLSLNNSKDDRGLVND